MRIAPVRIPTNQLRQRLLDFDYLLSQQHPSTISRELEKSYPYTLGSCSDAWSVWMPSDEQTPQAKSWSVARSAHHQTICWGSPTASSSENLLGHPPCSFGQSHFGEASGHQWSLECKVAEYPYLCHAWESTSLGHGQHLWRHQANTSSNWSLKNMTISAIEIESWPDLAVRSIEQWQGCLVAHPS